MHKMKISTERDNRKETNRNAGAEENNNCTKKFTRGVDSRLDQAKQRIGELKERYFEITESEEQNKKPMRKEGKSIRKLCDPNNPTNICIMKVSE